MVTLRPSFLSPSKVIQHAFWPIDKKQCGFVIHPSTSTIAEQLTIDPQALNGENYSGIYDENGDYIPQYCDNPEKVPQAAIVANPSNPAPSDPAASDPAPSEPAPSDPVPTE